jgi:hypothetical protein
MVKAARFRTYAVGERPALFDRVVQSWDTANKATELSDFSVCASWGITGKDLYLLHALRKRMEYPELKRAVLEQAAAFNANVVLIEDKASGTQLIQELVELGLHPVTRYQAQSDKIMRSRRCRRQRLSRQAKLRFATSMHASEPFSALRSCGWWTSFYTSAGYWPEGWMRSTSFWRIVGSFCAVCTIVLYSSTVRPWSVTAFFKALFASSAMCCLSDGGASAIFCS